MGPVNPEPIANLILGTGPTAMAAAYALQRHGVPFEVLDVAYDLEPEREAMVEALAATEPADWPPQQVEALFPPPITSARGVEKRLAFGSSFPYERPQCISCSTTQCTIDMSYGLGGFGKRLGCCHDSLCGARPRQVPISAADLADSYRNVSRFVPMSAEPDRLQDPFPLYQDKVTTLTESEQTQNLLSS
jgi:hypothetical protein